jgi:hypothetical protein
MLDHVQSSYCHSACRYKGQLALYVYFLVCAKVLRGLSPPLALMTAQEAALSGNFRNAHQRCVKDLLLLVRESFLPFSLASRQLNSALWPRIVPSAEVRSSQVGFKWRTSRTSHLSGKSMRGIKILRERSAFSSNLLCPVQKTTDVAPSQKVRPDCFCTSSVKLLLVKWRTKYLGGSVNPFLEQVACYFREVSMLCFMPCKNGLNEPDCGSFSTKSTRSAAD